MGSQRLSNQYDGAFPLTLFDSEYEARSPTDIGLPENVFEDGVAVEPKTLHSTSTWRATPLGCSPPMH